ncbi:hypothetical protein [Actinoplanes sichuanensis]|uniref:YtxH-like protein n=1 Tax=Actinoplanes sichuanensis TaxID=512349 RepID=A0ABW4A202_9ACTN
MALGKLAAGLAIGYVLGARAGRDKYEQVAATARRLSAHPTAVQAQQKVKALVNTGTETVNAKLEAAAVDEPVPAVQPARRQRARRNPSTPVAGESSL